MHEPSATSCHRRVYTCRVIPAGAVEVDHGQDGIGRMYGDWFEWAAWACGRLPTKTLSCTGTHPRPHRYGRMEQDPTRYPLLAAPHIRLSGSVDEAMYTSFREQLLAAPTDGTLVVSITTLGGDPEVARAMGTDIRMLRDFQGREILFLGKVAVYSAGSTFMSYFPVEHRFLTRRTRLMLHERQLTKTINLSGPLRSCIAQLKATLHEIEHSIMIEEEGFHDIVDGSQVSFEELHEKAPANWYIGADEARDRGLVLDVI